MTEERGANQETQGTKVRLVWMENEVDLGLLDNRVTLDLVDKKGLKGPKEIKVKKAKKDSLDKKDLEELRVGVVLLVPEVW